MKTKLICPICNKEYYLAPSLAKKSQVCSLKCRDILYHQTVQNSKQPLVCVICGTEYYKPPSRAKESKVCSRKCWSKRLGILHSKPKKRLICSVCGKKYLQHAYRKDTSHYCSKECWSKRNPPINKICPICNKEFVAYHKAKKYCSKHCANIASRDRKGELSANWKGGTSLTRKRAVVAFALKEWRIALFIRDNHTCQQCGCRQDLHAHHIKHFADYPEERFNVDNGITLCIDCHGKIHNKNFKPNRQKFKPFCIICGIETKGCSQYCSSCAITLWHQKRKLEIQNHQIPEQPSFL